MNATNAARVHVIWAATAWWKSRRPLGWSEADHLSNPTINQLDPGGADKQLARAVARLLKETAQADDATPLVQDLYDLAIGKKVDRFSVLRRAEAFLRKREVQDDPKPIERDRSGAQVRVSGRLSKP